MVSKTALSLNDHYEKITKIRRVERGKKGKSPSGKFDSLCAHTDKHKSIAEWRRQAATSARNVISDILPCFTSNPQNPFRAESHQLLDRSVKSPTGRKEKQELGDCVNYCTATVRLILNNTPTLSRDRKRFSCSQVFALNEPREILEWKFGQRGGVYLPARCRRNCELGIRVLNGISATIDFSKVDLASFMVILDLPVDLSLGFVALDQIWFMKFDRNNDGQTSA